MNPFKLHPQLRHDSIILGAFSLCQLLLVNNRHFPWFILVPQVENKTELHQLSKSEQQQYFIESMNFSRCLEAVFKPDKINIASLGNKVAQLHIHHIARFKTDACWPAPVWGATEASTYTDIEITHLKQKLQLWFSDNNKFSWKI